MSERAGEIDYLDVLSQPSGERELAAQAPKKKAKRKMSPKQKAAAMKNLRKAQKALKRKEARHGGHRTSKAWRKHTAKIKKLGGRKAIARRVAARSKAREATPKQRAAARRNIKKAQAALRAKKKTHRLTPRRHARSTQASEAKAMKKGKKKSKQTPAQRAASKRNIKKAIAKNRKKGRSKSKGKTLAKRSANRTAMRPPTPRKAARRGKKGKARRRFTQKARAAAMRNLGKARAARKRAKAAGRKHDVRAYSYHSRPKRVRVPAHRSYEKRGKRKHKQSPKARAASLRNLRKARAARRRGAHEGYMEAMVNALTGAEVVIGFGSALSWFMVTDFVDRLLATHALTDKGTKDAAGHELYADNPPTTGDYAGLFNPTAICAPMNVTRWLVGLLGMTGVPLGISFAVSDDLVRSTLQMASFGAGLRILGKAAMDLVAYVVMWNPLGQQLYDGEMRAQVYASGDQNPLASLPSTGLGRTTGTGAAANDGKANDGKAGAGYPSMPREQGVAPSTATGSDAGAPPPPAPPVQTTGQLQGGALAGLPPKRSRSHGAWGYKEVEEVAA